MYALISDTHCHNWTAFASVTDKGINSRLQIILNGIEEAASFLKQKGGKYLFHAGDLFHVRGSVAPSVLNPTLDLFKRIVEMGIQPVILCGNHDAEFRETNELGSSISSLRGIGCQIINEPTIIDTEDGSVLCVPWIADKDEFLEAVKKFADKPCDLVCHVALDGVFDRIESSACISPETIKETAPNVQRIFAGHLHKHKQLNDFAWSIGSIAQHNWGDMGSQPGFMMVGSDTVEFYKNDSPQFIDIENIKDYDSLAMAVHGNYVRAIVEMKESDADRYRQGLYKMGAMGVTLICHVPTEARADRINITNRDTLEDVVGKYINEHIPPEFQEKVRKITSQVMSELE